MSSKYIPNENDMIRRINEVEKKIRKKDENSSYHKSSIFIKKLKKILDGCKKY